MLTRLMAKQLRSPSGAAGLLFGRAMNKLNFDMNAFAVRQLDVGVDHLVADIGFGGGVSLRLLLDLACCGRVVGIESSQTMLRRARRRFAEDLVRGRLELREGVAESLPCPTGCFDRVCTINTLYFLPDPLTSFRELRRVLKAGGRLAVGYRPAAEMRRMPFADHGFMLYESADVEAMLVRAGFSLVETDEGQDHHLRFICTTAEKRDSQNVNSSGCSSHAEDHIC